MVQNGDTINDGADEKMLGAGDEKDLLAAKKEEVKFITGDQQNGDAKIDIGTINNKDHEMAFTGMSKEELMKYANDPFWVRLRWIFFVLFWGTWVAMLIGAVLIIINAPKCAAPTPLAWYKEGPLIKFDLISVASKRDVEQAKQLFAKGVIYELAEDDTYEIQQKPEIQESIKKCIENYKDTEINVILDITPNYVSQNSELFKNAIEDKAKRSAFIWHEGESVPNNWLSLKNGSAWHSVNNKNYVLAQFGDNRFDLNMNDTHVRNELIRVLNDLIQLGVKGFRLSNTKHFLINTNLENEILNNNPNYLHIQYGAWTHSHTTFQDGLGFLLQDYKLAVKNISNDVFLSVTDDIVRPEVFQTTPGEFGIDLPIYGRFTHSLAGGNFNNEKLYTELDNIFDNVANMSWVQWNYDLDNLKNIHVSAYNMFLMLLPGVPVIPGTHNWAQNISSGPIELRKSASFMHGNTNLLHQGNLIAYSRIKSGNPGFLVILNPTGAYETGNFSSAGLPEKMTIDLLSDNYNVTDIGVKSKMMSESIKLSPYSAAILTYVPVKSG